MRKIEQQMCDAIANNKPWRSGNTEVALGSNGVSYVFLHSNLIAEVDDDTVTVYDGGGWRTVTTKSRLNAICSRFCVAGEGVSQRKGEWYIHKLAGMAGTSKVFVEIPFTNGYTFP